MSIVDVVNSYFKDGGRTEPINKDLLNGGILKVQEGMKPEDEFEIIYDRLMGSGPSRQWCLMGHLYFYVPHLVYYSIPRTSKMLSNIAETDTKGVILAMAEYDLVGVGEKKREKVKGDALLVVGKINRAINYASAGNYKDMLREAKEKYIAMRVQGIPSSDAFEETIRPFGELIVAIQNNDILHHPAYERIMGYLKKLESSIVKKRTETASASSI